jgi:hypothetical protein
MKIQAPRLCMFLKAMQRGTRVTSVKTGACCRALMLLRGLLLLGVGLCSLQLLAAQNSVADGASAAA